MSYESNSYELNNELDLNNGEILIRFDKAFHASSSCESNPLPLLYTVLRFVVLLAACHKYDFSQSSSNAMRENSDGFLV